MKRRSLIVLPIVALVVLACCNAATADIIPASADYRYSAASQGGNWTVANDPGGYGTPSWFTFPFSNDAWIVVSNRQQSDAVKQFWFEGEVPKDFSLSLNPTLVAPQGCVVTSATSAQNDDSSATWYAWTWTINPAPSTAILEIPALFPWSSIQKIDVA